MMNGPFFRNYSKQQPKVVSVPVHFVSSDQPPTTMSMLKDSAALNIQKVFRGYAVRKIVKKIVSIRDDVSEIQRRIEDIKFVDLIRGDAKERLRVNETLMSLLFKLDSIRGVDSGIRDLRKAVTRKAIALQEKVDSIAQRDDQTLDSPESTSDQITEASNSPDDEIVNHHVNSVEAAAGDASGEVEAMEASPAVNLSEFGGNDNNKSTRGDVQGQNYGKGNREILENLMDDNEKLMRMMSEISERNEMQTRMINVLSRRVEDLEKAEKLRKKKAHVPSRRRRLDKHTFCI